MPRTLAIGDIHGCLTALKTLAAFVDIQDDDTLITLGDYIDRGPDSAGVVDWVMERHSVGQVVPLRGNHELMLLDAYQDPIEDRGWLHVGGRETLQSYARAGHGNSVRDIPDSHFDFFADHCQRYHETDTHIFVHASVHYDSPMDEQPDWLVYWEKWSDGPPHVSGKTVVCGHTSQKTGWPRSNGHSTCIDTWVYGRGWLTCLDVDSGWLWQANQDGETRSGWLNDDAPEC